jgi:hypothetical protein
MVRGVDGLLGERTGLANKADDDAGRSFAACILYFVHSELSLFKHGSCQPC